MDYSLEVSNLSKHYKDFSLNNINFSLPNGSIMGFIGKNGAGKSTTIKSILNIVKHDSGQAKILGLDAFQENNEIKIKDQISVILGGCYFHETLTAKAISTIMAKLYSHWDTKTYQNYLKTFSLPEKKLIKEFSTGMKMKLNIAVALSHSPKLLILDEATSGLDPIVRSEILDVFFEFIQEEDHSIFMSSHITTDLEKICDYITFIHGGNIIFSDQKDSLLENHGILRCGIEDFKKIDSSDIAGYRQYDFGYEVLLNNRLATTHKYHKFTIDTATLEDIMLFYGKEKKK